MRGGYSGSQTAVNFGGINTMRQPESSRNFRGKVITLFLLGVLAASTSFGAPQDSVPNSTARCFPVFDATLFTNKPDLTTAGLQKITLVDPDRWLSPGQTRGQIPADSSIKSALHTSMTSAVLVLDSEDWPLQGTSGAIGEATNNYLTLLSRVRQTGVQGLVGYYGAPPIRDYWRAIGLPSSQNYLAWQAENNLLQPLANAVDVLFPSIYTFYNDQAGWTKYAIANLSEARRLAGGKPVYAFIWPQFHDSNKTLGLQPIPGEFWALQLRTVAQYSDGVVIWGGWKVKWDEQAEWWQATRQFMLTAPQICRNPSAPSDLRAHP